MWNITFQSVNFKSGAMLEEFACKKVKKLFEQDSSIIRADIKIFESSAEIPENQCCEIQLSVSGENHFIKKNSENYEKSISLAVDSLRKVLRRKKTKMMIDRRKMLE